VRRLIAAVVVASAAGISLIGTAPAYAFKLSSTNSICSPAGGIHYAYSLTPAGNNSNVSSAVRLFGGPCV